MGLFRRKTKTTTTAKADDRRPYADPDSDVVVWVTDAQLRDNAALDRIVAQARNKH